MDPHADPLHGTDGRAASGMSEESHIKSSSEEDAADLIEKLRREGKLKALPIIQVDKANLTLLSCDGKVLREYGVSGTWVCSEELQEGSIRYLGSASHAGHIELKALYVMSGGRWYNIVSGESEPHIDSWLA